DAKLLVFGACAYEGFCVAAQMKRHARPVADREQRDSDLVPLCLRASKGTGVEIVAQPEMQRVGRPRIGNLLGSATDRVVHQMRSEPVAHEYGQDTSMEKRVAVNIREAFPGNNRL